MVYLSGPKELFYKCQHVFRIIEFQALVDNLTPVTWGPDEKPRASLQKHSQNDKYKCLTSYFFPNRGRCNNNNDAAPSLLGPPKYFLNESHYVYV